MTIFLPHFGSATSKWCIGPPHFSKPPPPQDWLESTSSFRKKFFAISKQDSKQSFIVLALHCIRPNFHSFLCIMKKENGKLQKDEWDWQMEDLKRLMSQKTLRIKTRRCEFPRREFYDGVKTGRARDWCNPRELGWEIVSNIIWPLCVCAGLEWTVNGTFTSP